MKKVLISLILIIVGIALGIFMSIKQQNDFYGYYSKTDKEISQNIEKSIELTSLNHYSKTVYNFKNVKQIFLIGPYSWRDNNFTKPFNNRIIVSHWQSLLAEEDKYLLIITNNESFLPIILWRGYSKDDFKKLETSLLTNKLCNQAQGAGSCKLDNPVNIDISNVGKGKTDITIKINTKEE